MSYNLLTVDNPKTRKGEKHGWLTGVLHLAPASLSGYNVCPYSTPGCREACLNTAGRGWMAPVQEARVRRTRLFFQDRSAFMGTLISDIERLERAAKLRRLRCAVRLNGTSDIGWEAVSYGGLHLFDKFPRVQFYDYTKRLSRVLNPLPKNYSLTYSRSEETDTATIQELIRNRVAVAVVFSTRKGEELPKTWRGMRVLDGDAHDLRFLKRGGIVGLRAKGRAQQDKTGFVVQI